MELQSAAVEGPQDAARPVEPLGGGVNVSAVEMGFEQVVGSSTLLLSLVAAVNSTIDRILQFIVAC